MADMMTLLGKVHPIKDGAPWFRVVQGQTMHLIITMGDMRALVAAAASLSTFNIVESDAGTGWIKDEELVDRACM